MPDLKTTTRAAILGQLALRDWGGYELARSMRRSVHWFWPRAESVIYAEAKRLVEDGLATSREEPAEDGSRRSRAVYSITEAGHDLLRDWLRAEPVTQTSHSEPLLRLHLARFGTRDDLLATIGWLEGVSAELLADADAVATEFVEGRHLFQDEAHVRGLLFDALAGQGLLLRRWAADARAEVQRWGDMSGDEPARRRALRKMRAYLDERPAPG